MVSRSVTAIALILTFSFIASAQQVQLASRFQPNKEYSMSIAVGVSGTDGYKDIVPSASSQRVHIRTGAPSGGAFPVEMTMYSPVQQHGSTVEERVQWKFAFSENGGDIENISILSSDESMEQSLARSILHRYLADILFSPVYTLETGRNTGTPMVERTVRRDGVGEVYDVTYVMNLPALKEAGAPMAQHAGGYGVYDAQLGFFTELVKQEMSKIYQYEDATGEEHHIVMNRETKILTSIRDVTQ
jgi:hypothetical protein